MTDAASGMAHGGWIPATVRICWAGTCRGGAYKPAHADRPRAKGNTAPGQREDRRHRTSRTWVLAPPTVLISTTENYQPEPTRLRRVNGLRGRSGPTSGESSWIEC